MDLPNTIYGTGRLITADFTTTTPIGAQEYLRSDPGAKGLLVSCKSSQPGTLDVFRLNFQNEMDRVWSQPVASNDLTLLIFYLPIRYLFVSFTPSAFPGSVWVEGESYPIGDTV